MKLYQNPDSNNPDAFLHNAELNLSTQLTPENSELVFDLTSGSVKPQAAAFISLNPVEWQNSKIGEKLNNLVGTLERSQPKDLYLTLASVLKDKKFEPFLDQMSGMKILGQSFDEVANDPNTLIDLYREKNQGVSFSNIEMTFEAFKKERSEIITALKKTSVEIRQLDPKSESENLVIPFSDASEFGAQNSLRDFAKKSAEYNSTELSLHFNAGRIDKAVEFCRGLNADDLSQSPSTALKVVTIAALANEQEMLSTAKAGILKSVESAMAPSSGILRDEDRYDAMEGLSKSITTMSVAHMSNLVNNEIAGDYRGVAASSISKFNEGDHRNLLPHNLHENLHRTLNYLTKEDLQDVTRSMKNAIPKVDLSFPSQEFSGKYQTFKEKLDFALNNPGVNPNEKLNPTKSPSMQLGR